jgi:2-oxoisovalerate dehydrogenase E1 component alpha subunit
MSTPDVVDLMTQLLRTMVLARSLDNAATSLQRQGELGLWPSLLGQEAAQAGAAAALAPTDVVFGTYREHAIYSARGVAPIELLSLYRGSTLGGWDPHQTGCFLPAIVIGAQGLHAVGYAFGMVRDAHRRSADAPPDRAVLACLGDGAFSQGETNEAFIWAATHQLPVVFLCQNNQWAISSPTTVQSRVPFADRGLGFGIPGVRVDGNDAVACYQAVHDALALARRGGGPTLIEAVTYRLNPHTTSDDDTRYRTDTEKEAWRARDPIAHTLQQLREHTQAADDIMAALAAEASALDERVRRECRALPDPDPMDPFRYTLTEMTTPLAQQSREFLRSYTNGDPA